jgi:hypothetical protein
MSLWTKGKSSGSEGRMRLENVNRSCHPAGRMET